MPQVTLALSKSDQAKLLLLAFECSTSADGWPQFLTFIETTVGCHVFLSEFDSNGSTTPAFAGHRPGHELGNVMAQIEMEGGRNAFEFLLTEASLYYPYCKTSLDRSNGPGSQIGQQIAGSRDMVQATPDNALRSAPGLICPVNRANDTAILFAFLFPDEAPDAIDTVSATEIFQTIVNLLVPALGLHQRLVRERRDYRLTKMLLASMDSPGVLVDQHREILAQTPSALECLKKLNVAKPQGNTLVFQNPQIEAGFRQLCESWFSGNVDASGVGMEDTRESEPPSLSLCISGPNNFPRRVSIEVVSSRSRETAPVADPWFVLRVFESVEPNRHVETLLQEEFDLSQSEARLARELTLTGSMHDTVTRLGITRNTAKTHLRRIFEKTGVNTQLQLARLVHKLSGLF